MLPEAVKDKIIFELEAIETELDATKNLFVALRDRKPDAIEIRAAASTLHAFYNGVEKIFSLIARQIDGAIPDDGGWHSSLLNSMAVANEKRDMVIDDNVHKLLEKYLAFRHFFRHSYGFILDWEELKPLCHGVHDVFILFRKEILRFIGQ